MGWIVSRHGALYAAEHGYNQQFEGVVARHFEELVELGEKMHA